MESPRRKALGNPHPLIFKNKPALFEKRLAFNQMTPMILIMVNENNKSILEAQSENEQMVNTYGYGEVAIWNYILCKQQDAEMENDADNWIAYVESGLCDETEECQEAFQALGVFF